MVVETTTQTARRLSPVTVSERRKGLRGQQEVQRIVKAAGLTIRRLTHTGDALAVTPGGATLHLETKRQERLQLKQWIQQAGAEAPRGAVPVVVWRQSAGEWRADLSLSDLLALIHE